MRANLDNVAILYHGGQHPSLTIFKDYLKGIQAQYPDALLLDYFALYLLHGCKTFDKAVCTALESFGCGLIFILPGSGDLTLSPSLLAQLSEHARLIINFFDSELFFEQIDQHYAKYADLVLVPSLTPLVRFAAIGVKSYCTFSLFDPERYPSLCLLPVADVSFVGNLLKARRRQYIEDIRSAGIAIEVAGYGTPMGIISHEKMIQLFNSSRINLNFCDAEEPSLLLYSITKNLPERQLKGRITEIALTGGFVLTDYAPGLEEMYMIGKEIVVFENTADLVEKISYYLKHEEERLAIAQAGHLRALKDYNCSTAFVKINAMIPERCRPHKVYDSEFFRCNQANFLFYYVVRFLLSLQLVKLFYEFRHVLASATFNAQQAFRLAIRAVSSCLNNHPILLSYYNTLKVWTIVMTKKRCSYK